MQTKSTTDPTRYASRYCPAARCLIVVNGAGHVAATFDVGQGAQAEAEAHRLNYLAARDGSWEGIQERAAMLAAEERYAGIDARIAKGKALQRRYAQMSGSVNWGSEEVQR